MHTHCSTRNFRVDKFEAELDIWKGRPQDLARSNPAALCKQVLYQSRNELNIERHLHVLVPNRHRHFAVEALREGCLIWAKKREEFSCRTETRSPSELALWQHLKSFLGLTDRCKHSIDSAISRLFRHNDKLWASTL